MTLVPESFGVELSDGSTREFKTELDWLAFMKQGFHKIDDLARLENFMARNRVNLLAVRASYPDAATSCVNGYDDRLKELSPCR